MSEFGITLSPFQLIIIQFIWLFNDLDFGYASVWYGGLEDFCAEANWGWCMLLCKKQYEAL